MIETPCCKPRNSDFRQDWQLAGLLLCASFGIGAAHAQPATQVGTNVGTSYGSQKISYKDPVSARTVWRMTVDGTAAGAMNSLVDQSGMEGNRWSPDGRFICYGKSRNPGKPIGTYIMDIDSGVERFIASGERYGRGTCEFSKVANEIYYFTSSRAGHGPWMELRATDLESGAVRVLRHYDGVDDAMALSQNADGSLLAVVVTKKHKKLASWKHHISILNPQGRELPAWKFRATGKPDMVGNPDAPYWSPVDRNVIRITRDGTNKVLNVETLADVATPKIVGEPGLHGSHSCWTVDGLIMFHTWGHADCYPLDRGLGDETRVVLDLRRAESPYLYLTQMRQADGFSVVPQGLGDVIAVHYNYDRAAGDNNNAHSHPQFSRDGKYVLFQSAVTNSAAGAAPGGMDKDPRSVDLFIVQLDAPGIAQDSRKSPEKAGVSTGSTQMENVSPADPDRS